MGPPLRKEGESMAKWLWKQHWEFLTLDSLARSISRRVVKWVIPRYLLEPFPLQKRDYGTKSKSLSCSRFQADQALVGVAHTMAMIFGTGKLPFNPLGTKCFISIS